MSENYFDMKGEYQDSLKEPKAIQKWPIAFFARGGELPYMGHIGMCRCEGYGFQAVYRVYKSDCLGLEYHFLRN